MSSGVHVEGANSGIDQLLPATATPASALAYVEQTLQQAKTTLTNLETGRIESLEHWDRRVEWERRMVAHLEVLQTTLLLAAAKEAADRAQHLKLIVANA